MIFWPRYKALGFVAEVLVCTALAVGLAAIGPWPQSVTPGLVVFSLVFQTILRAVMWAVVYRWRRSRQIC